MNWEALESDRRRSESRHVKSLFDQDPDRAEKFSVRADDLLFDFSKVNIDSSTLQSLVGMARNHGIENLRDAMFVGKPINQTEGRAVLHMALRNLSTNPMLVDGRDVMPGVRGTLWRMGQLAESIISGKLSSSSGEKFRDVLNVGIGGSDLGPAMAHAALQPYRKGPKAHFLSNVDGAHANDILAGLDPETTFVVVASKTFTTTETMTNARTVRDWMKAKCGPQAVRRQFAAVSSNLELTDAFGVDRNLVFGFGDWVGGRFSVWGPVGLTLMISIGFESFKKFLAGGHAMDNHFCSATLERNIPCLLALTGIWHNQICGHPTRAILPYDQRLVFLPKYLQQLEMESNGKSITREGTGLQQRSCPVIWGEPGTNGQHAFYQMIHQGNQIVPCEFLLAARGHEPDLELHQELLVANCLAQSQALMEGRTFTEEESSGDLLLARHRSFAGNRPSTTLLYPKLTSYTLGQIIALYEHRVFVEGAILGINSFDQWGVELGKELAKELLPMVRGRESSCTSNASTALLLDYIHACTRTAG